MSYFLTGEYRPYIKRFGTYDRVVPNSNFFLVRGHDGCGGGSGLGAIELLYRFSFDDLNSNGINGGTVAEHTVGLNSMWTPNIRMQFNYTNANRNSVGELANAGTVQGLGCNMIIDILTGGPLPGHTAGAPAHRRSIRLQPGARAPFFQEEIP